MSQGILWRSPIFDFSGYATLARDVLLTLDRNGIPLQVIPCLLRDKKFIEQMSQRQPEEVKTWNHLLNARITDGIHVIFHPPVTWDGINHFQGWMREHPEFRSYVGITMFETDRLPHGWADACNQMDEVWIPSQFNRETFERAGVAPERLHVMPFGLNADLYDPEKITPLIIPGKRKYAFLSVFQWNRRKGWDVLLRAYLQAFSSHEDVCLIIRSYPDALKEPPIRDRIRSFIHELGYDPDKIPPIIVIDEFIPDDRMPNLYRSADCFVLPTRGEGWGVPYMEAMASGLPVIATKWSSHLDFMDDQNSYLIKLDGMEHITVEHLIENPLYTLDQKWASPSVEHTARLMRYVFENREASRSVGALARKNISEQWTLERSAEWVIERLTITTSSNSLKPPVRTVHPKLTHEVPCSFKDITAKPYIQPSIPKTIGIDARVLTNQESMLSDVGHYTYNHLASLIKQTPEWRYVLYIDSTPSTPEISQLALYPNVTISSFSDIRSHKLDLYHITDSMTLLPGFESPFLLAPLEVPTSLVFYDLIPLVFVNRFIHNRKEFEQQQYVSRLKYLITSNAHLLCISRATRNDLKKYLDIPDQRLHTVWAGLNTEMPVETDRYKKLQLLEKLGINNIPYFLHIGAHDEYKNFDTVFSVHQAVREKFPCKLVVVGSLTSVLKEHASYVYENDIPDIVFTDVVSREELDTLYSEASGLMFLSRYEGFGFPLLEAMAKGCPVIASNVTSIPDVAGNAAILLDPDDVHGVAEAMVRLISDPSLREELIQRGYRQARRFTWEDVARRTIQIWEEMLCVPRQTAKTPAITVENSTRPLIAVDLRTLEYPQTAERGIGRYTVHHLTAMISRTPDWDYQLCLSSTNPNRHIEPLLKLPNTRLVSISAPQGQPDWHHIPDPLTIIAGYQSPFDFFPNAPKSAVLYDLIPIALHEELYDTWPVENQKAYIDRLRQLIASRARLLSISRHSKEDCMRLIGLPDEQITVIMAGLNLAPQSAAATPSTLMARCGIVRPYFLSVGGVENRKRFDLTLLAFAEVNQHIPCQLVVVGTSDDHWKKMYAAQAFQAGISGVILTGFIDDEELARLYAGASALLFPSTYEGFGFPVLEAMTCGCPVIAAHATSVPEVGGEAVLYVQPGNYNELINAMYSILSDNNLISVLRMKGLARARQFSWDNVADQSISLIRQSLEATTAL